MSPCTAEVGTFTSPARGAPVLITAAVVPNKSPARSIAASFVDPRYSQHVSQSIQRHKWHCERKCCIQRTQRSREDFPQRRVNRPKDCKRLPKRNPRISIQDPFHRFFRALITHQLAFRGSSLQPESVGSLACQYPHPSKVQRTSSRCHDRY